MLNDPNYVKAQGVLENIELFDAAFFGFSPREAEITDPLSHTLQSTSLVNSFGQMTVINLDTDGEIIKQESQENPINLSKADDIARTSN